MNVLVVSLGLALGSFWNTVIHRIPRGESPAAPASRCPACGGRLGVADLVPVLSYAWLGGRCRHCGGRISPRYPAVELLTATVTTLIYVTYYGTKEFWPYLALSSVLILVSFIDLEHMYIPDALLAAGTLAWSLCLLLDSAGSLKAGAGGAGLGFGLMFVIYLLARGGMGFGDVKFAALIGLYLGPALMLLAIIAGFACGCAVGVWLVLAGKKGLKDRIPFGPFLGLGAMAAMLCGRPLIAWYLRLVGF